MVSYCEIYRIFHFALFTVANRHQRKIAFSTPIELNAHETFYTILCSEICHPCHLRSFKLKYMEYNNQLWWRYLVAHRGNLMGHHMLRSITILFVAARVVFDFLISPWVIINLINGSHYLALPGTTSRFPHAFNSQSFSQFHRMKMKNDVKNEIQLERSQHTQINPHHLEWNVTMAIT